MLYMFRSLQVNILYGRFDLIEQKSNDHVCAFLTSVSRGELNATSIFLFLFDCFYIKFEFTFLKQKKYIFGYFS